MNGDRPNWRRRALLAAGLLATVAWVKGAPYLGSLGSPDLEFEDIAGLSPFRWLTTTGATTSGAAIFAGLDASKPLTEEQIRLDESVKADPCRAFYGGQPAGPMTVAMFSDFACPNCKIMEARIAELQASDPGSFRFVRHQLPILGAASATASRAVLAAEKQGFYSEMHARLLRTPAVTDLSFVTAIAADLGLDADQFQADLNSEETRQQLLLAKAIARVFGFYGTPAFAVGRTVFLGAIPKSTLQALIENEVDNPC